jgi:DNA polymerase V
VLSARSDKSCFALVDVNNFYVSCERVFQPKLANIPVVVLSNNDGCVISRSKEAKQIGIPMGAPYHLMRVEEKSKLQIFSSNYALYEDLSKRFFSVLHEFTDRLEQYSIDEVFLDLAHLRNSDLVELGCRIKSTVYRITKLPVCVGFGETKTLSKLANHYAKKIEKLQGVCNLIAHPKIDAILEKTEVQSIWGIGYATANSLIKSGVSNALLFRNSRESWVKKRFTIFGLKIQQELKGMPCIDMEMIHKPKKHIMVTRSFGRRVTVITEMREAVSTFASMAYDKLKKENEFTSSVTVYLRAEKTIVQKKLSLYETIQLDSHTKDLRKIVQAALVALERIFIFGIEYKKAGVLLGRLSTETNLQRSLFEEPDKDREDEFSKMYFQIRKKTSSCNLWKRKFSLENAFGNEIPCIHN